MTQAEKKLARARELRSAQLETEAAGRREAVRRCVACGAVREGDGLGALLWPAAVAFGLMVAGVALVAWGMMA